MESMGGTIITHGDNCVITEIKAREESSKYFDRPYISPYNDLHVMSGQGTISLEMDYQIQKEGEEFDYLFVCIGGGGLIGGMSSYWKGKPEKEKSHKKIKIIGVQPINSAVMYHSIQAGKILQDVDEKETLSTATAGGIEENSITFEVCRQFVDDYVLVEEEEIKEAWKNLLYNEHLLVEAAAALSLAGLYKYVISHPECLHQNSPQKTVFGVLMCGRNMTKEQIHTLLN